MCSVPADRPDALTVVVEYHDEPAKRREAILFLLPYRPPAVAPTDQPDAEDDR